MKGRYTMAVRNFYASSRADDRASSVGIGPARSTGGMSTTHTQRDEGEIIVAFTVESFARNDGTLRTEVRDGQGLMVAEHITKR